MWLKNQNEPEGILHKLWSETAEYRLKFQKNEYVMNIYPAFQKPTGHFLVSDLIYPCYLWNRNLIK